jgi:hypothetical protein
MNVIERRSFESETEFREFCRAAGMVYFYIYAATPNPAVVEALVRETGPGETILLLNADDDRGFLRGTTELVRENGKLRAKPLIEMRGVGSWANGTVGGYYDSEAEVPNVVANARKRATYFSIK